MSLTDEDIDRLYKTKYQKLIQFFKNRGYSPSECEDMAQNTFLRAHQKRSTFSGKGSPQSWLFGIARNLMLNDKRTKGAAKNKAEHFVLEEDQHTRIDIETAESALDHLIDKEKREVLTRAVRRLPPEQGNLLKLRLENKTYQQIADVSQKTLNTVKSTLSKAIEKIKRSLTDSG